MHTIYIPDDELEFTYVRSSGAGGQNVNKVNSKAVLKWNYLATICMNTDQKLRFAKLHSAKIAEDGFVIITAQEFRDQPRNADRCLEKLKKMIKEAMFIPKVRKKTKPTRSSKEKRLETKKRHGNIKNLRRRPIDG